MTRLLGRAINRDVRFPVRSHIIWVNSHVIISPPYLCFQVGQLVAEFCALCTGKPAYPGEVREG